jgi:tripartite-type tricarboxylate transporter receptor subunit TctC
MKQWLIALAMAAGLVLGFRTYASADAYPKSPVRIIVPYAAGGSTDSIARLMAKELSEQLGQSFYVENRPGAGGMIAHEMISKVALDGSTLLFSAAGPLVVTPHIYAKVPYRPIADFAPVKLIATAPLLLVVNPKIKAHNVGELLALARKNPGKMTYGSFGYGSAAHLAGELLKIREKVDITHVPFKGSAPALTSLMGGQIDMMFDVLVTALPQVKAGNLRALAVTSDKRSDQAPDVPTMAESGVKDFDAGTWFGLLARAGTSPEIIATLSAALDKSLAKPEVRAALTSQGADIAGGTPEHFGKFFKSEYDKWGAIVKKAGIKSE